MGLVWVALLIAPRSPCPDSTSQRYTPWNIFESEPQKGWRPPRGPPTISDTPIRWQRVESFAVARMATWTEIDRHTKPRRVGLVWVALLIAPRSLCPDSASQRRTPWNIFKSEPQKGWRPPRGPPTISDTPIRWQRVESFAIARMATRTEIDRRQSSGRVGLVWVALLIAPRSACPNSTSQHHTSGMFADRDRKDARRSPALYRTHHSCTMVLAEFEPCRTACRHSRPLRDTGTETSKPFDFNQRPGGSTQFESAAGGRAADTEAPSRWRFTHNVSFWRRRRPWLSRH